MASGVSKKKKKGVKKLKSKAGRKHTKSKSDNPPAVVNTTPVVKNTNNKRGCFSQRRISFGSLDSKSKSKNQQHLQKTPDNNNFMNMLGPYLHNLCWRRSGLDWQPVHMFNSGTQRAYFLRHGRFRTKEEQGTC